MMIAATTALPQTTPGLENPGALDQSGAFAALFANLVQTKASGLETANTVLNSNSAVTETKRATARDPHNVEASKDAALKAFTEKTINKTSQTSASDDSTPPQDPRLAWMALGGALVPAPEGQTTEVSSSRSQGLPQAPAQAMLAALTLTKDAGSLGEATPTQSLELGGQTPLPTSLDFAASMAAGTPRMPSPVPDFWPNLSVLAPGAIPSANGIASDGGLLEPAAAPTTNDAKAVLEETSVLPGGRIGVPLEDSAWAEAFGQHTLNMITRGLNGASIQVTPEHLGPIQVTLDLKHDQASAVFVSPHDAVRQAIEVSLPHLRDLFSQAGLNLGQASVEANLNQSGHASAWTNPTGNRASEAHPERLEESDLTATETRPRVIEGLLDTYA